MSNYKFTTAFPIGIAHAEINDIEYINTLKDVVLENYNSDKRNVQSTHTLSVDRDDDPDWVTRGYPWQSNALQHKREVYSKLIDFVNENISKYMDSMGYYYEEFYTTQCWSNVYEKTRSIHPHRHYNSFLSWNFIISGQNAPFVLQQTSRGSFAPSLKFNTSENSEQIAIAPKSGLLTIFPSHIVHYTAPNRNDDFRITVSGNIMVSGQIGSYDELTYLNTKENK